MANPTQEFFFREPTIDRIFDYGWNRQDEASNGSSEAGEVDAWDCGFAARLRARAGLKHISIPAFPHHKFRLRTFCERRPGSIGARDGGKRVGIMQWDNTAGVWARGALNIITESILSGSIGWGARESGGGVRNSSAKRTGVGSDAGSGVGGQRD